MSVIVKRRLDTIYELQEKNSDGCITETLLDMIYIT